MGMISLTFFWACSDRDENKLFSRISPSDSGLSFTNSVANTEDFNIFSYRNFYNGGGVAIGDINNDGLPDIYLIANMGKNKLFIKVGVQVQLW
jgi:glutaminase